MGDAALIADWRRTVLSAIGVALGVTVVLGTLILKSELLRGTLPARPPPGFFLLGGSCQIELLVGSFNCEQRARDEKPTDGPGVPLQIPTVIAERRGLQLGDELRIPGLPPGSAHLGSTFPEFDRVEGV